MEDDIEIVEIKPVLNLINQAGKILIDFKPNEVLVPSDWNQLWGTSERENFTGEQRVQYEKELSKILHIEFIKNTEELD